MADFDKLAQMKPGDVFFECEYGTNIRARVLSAPVASNDGVDGRRVLRWEAENTENGEAISYMLTEGLDHYGPRIYDVPQYGRMQNGVWVTPLLGTPALESETPA
jgi:hypothetical protein